jgi:23S rRNA (pseudouridine1915-N3)-methyltransferase
VLQQKQIRANKQLQFNQYKDGQRYEENRIFGLNYRITDRKRGNWMLKVKVITVGNLKEKYWRDASSEYEKRLSRYVDLTVIEVKEARIGEKASAAEITQALNKEATEILKHMNPTDFVVSLAIEGKMFSSETFSALIARWEQAGQRIIFVIGSSHGLGRSIDERANLQLSVSNMTFPHQMIRIFLLEQVYRGYKILRHETYHK